MSVRLTSAQILSACDQLIDLHAWRADKIDPHGWIRNFDLSDQELAATLLRKFTFYADPLVDQLYVSAFQTLSTLPVRGWKSFGEAQRDWAAFFAGALLTWVEGEEPHPADSGPLFLRKARQLLLVDESQMCAPAEAVRRVMAGHTGAVIFVDDFVGSGQQFRTTWDRTYPTHGLPAFASVLASRSDVYYCNLMTTEWGLERINEKAPNVKVVCGNIIPRTHSLVGANSVVWPAALLGDIQALVESYSARLGYTANDGGMRDWRGFHQLGLGLAFEHSTPDASLPIFFTQANGWNPLVRRT